MKLPHSETRAVAITIAICMVLSGCNTVGQVNFEPASMSGKPVGDVMVLRRVEDQPKDFGALFTAYQNQCAAQEIAPAIAILAPVVGQLIFGLTADWATRKSDALKEAAEASYSGHLTMSTGELRGLVTNERCLTIVRYDPLRRGADGKEEAKRVALAAVLKLAPAVKGRDDAFVFTPVFVAGANSAAITRKVEDPAVAVGLALSIKSTGKQDNGLPGMFVVGQASSAAPNVFLNPVRSSCFEKVCAKSEPIPIPSGNDGLISLGIGVTEKGSLGFEADVAKAQLAAIKAAIGPAIGDIIKKKASADTE